MPHPYARELSAARDAATIASRIILEIGARLDARSSAPADVTTQADRDSQDAILRRLAEEFPDDAFRAEEKTTTLAQVKQSGERLWIIDPIDGTRGFVTKNGEYSVMIALCVAGELVVGVVAEPAFGRQVFASKNGGCFRQIGDGKPECVRVTATSQLFEATLIQSHVKPGKASREIDAIGPRRIVETYSAGVKLARVADGSVDLYVCDYATLNDWDLAAGHILVTEAGGQVTTLDGSMHKYALPSPEHHGGLLATNGVIHELTVAALRDPGREN